MGAVVVADAMITCSFGSQPGKLTVTSQQTVLAEGKPVATIQDVMNAYEEGLQSGIQLLGILVTEHGSEQEIPMGIITAQDLPEILQAFL